VVERDGTWILVVVGAQMLKCCGASQKGSEGSKDLKCDKYASMPAYVHREKYYISFRNIFYS